jgi:hypothetical protein
MRRERLADFPNSLRAPSLANVATKSVPNTSERTSTALAVGLATSEANANAGNIANQKITTAKCHARESNKR